MRKLKLFFACLLMAVLSIGQVWGADATWSWTLASGNNFGSASNVTTDPSGTKTLTGIVGSENVAKSWGFTMVSGTGTYYLNGAQIGSGTNYCTSVTLSTSAFTQTIKNVKVTSKCGSSATATISVAVGETKYVDAASLSTTETVYGLASNTGTSTGDIVISISQPSTHKAVYISKVEVVYDAGGASLSSIAVSGTPDKTIYEEGELFDPTGLIVTGTYSDASTAPISSGITWAYNPSQTLALNQTAIGVTATASELTSPEFEVTGLTVNEHVVTPGKYTINLNKGFYGIETAGNIAVEQSASQNDITVVSGCTSSASSKTYYDAGHIRYYADSYLHVSVPSGYVIKSIVFTASGTWNGGITANVGTYTADSKTWSGVAQEVDFSFTAQDRASSIEVTYAVPVSSAVAINDAIENGSVEVSGAADLSAVLEGTELTLSNNPAGGYKFGSYSVYKTGDTETTITITNNKFTMPDYAVTVSATFEATKTLTDIALSGEYPTVFLTGDAFSHEGMTVTATYDDNSQADVTDDATFTGYNMSSASAQTVTVSYTEGTEKTATYDITVKDAYTVTEILPLVPATGSLATRVKGYISQIDQYNSTYNSITYWISADGKTTSDQLEVYSGKNVGNTNFSAITDLEVGDFVTISGSVKTHTNGVKEFDKNNYIITGGRIVKGAVTGVVVSGTATKNTYSANETFETDGLVVTATYANGFSAVVTEGVTWGDNLTDHKVAASGNVAVTATVGDVTSAAYDVAITVSAKTVSSIAAGTAAYTIYTGEILPKPTITATYSEGDPADVSAEATYDSENVFDTNTTGEQTITVSYTFGANTVTTTYTVTVVDYKNADDAPYTVTEALYIITNAVRNVESAREIVVAGTVSVEKVNNYKNRYKISDGVNELLVYNGKGFNDEAFTDNNYPKVGDVMVVKGNVINYNNNTPEFASGKNYLLSQVRPATLAIEDVTGFEVGSADLAEDDLTITTASDGAITFVSGDEAVVTIVEGKLHAVAAGTATITANLAATANEGAMNYAATSTTFSVTVVAPATKYAITFSGNGATGGDAPEFASEAAAGANITLPASTYTYTGHSFTGWKVYDENEDEVTVTAGAFEMPASTVTIQAQWAEISVWATTYTSNVTLSYTGTGEANSQVKINNEDYAAQKVGSSGNDGSVVVTVPYGTHTLHFHAVAWNGKSVTIAASGVENMSESSFTLAADPGFKSSGTYTLENDPVGQYFVMTFTAVTEETQITFSKTDGDDKRFMLYGVNQEGGVLPVLDHIAISGDLDNKSYKAGQSLDMTGLTVEATYTLGGTPQTPVDITNDPGLSWTYDPLVENQEEVTVTAHFGEETANKTITGMTVTTADPLIYVSTLNVDFGSVDVDDPVPANETVTVTLTNVAAATATLGGTNPEAFSITPAALTTSGDITISILANTDAAATYSATLTISDDATENPAQSKTINLSFAVIEPVVNDEYELVLDVASLAAGDQIIIVAENEGDYYTLDGSISSQYFPSTVVSISAGIITAPSTSAIILGKDEDNWTMSMGGQLIGATAAKKASLGNGSASNTWTIAIAENVATITNTTTTYGSLQFNYNNGSNSRFLNYTSAQTAVAIYKKVTPEPPTPAYETVREELTAGYYYTMCLDKAVTHIKGGTIWRVLSKAENGKDVILEEVTGTLEAGRPYIFNASAEKLEVVYTGDAVGAPLTEGNHGLIGSFCQTKIDESENNFILYNNALYFVNSNNVYVGANRAYLDMTGVPAYSGVTGNAPGRRVVMAVHGNQVATDIESIQNSEVRIQKVMIDGQLYILRGEKMYDATGRLVK